MSDSVTFKLMVIAAFCTLIGVLTFMFSIYILGAGALVLCFAVWKLFINPIRLQNAEIRLKKAEASKLEVMTSIELTEAKLNLAHFPDVFLLKSDLLGNYPQLVTRAGDVMRIEPGNSAYPTKVGRIESIQEIEEDEEEELQQIEAPRIIRTLGEEVDAGAVTYNERESLLGYMDGEAFRARLFEEENNFFNSLMVVGVQGQGKTVCGTLLAAHTVNHGGYILIIDPDAREAQGLTNRLRALHPWLLCEVADTPEKAERVLDLAEAELDAPGNYPVILLVDEFSMLMRHMKMGGKWAKVAPRIASTVEDYATRGRKRRRRAVVFGQISNASRTGGTELRDSCAYVVFNISEKKAALVLYDAREEDIAEVAPTLEIGEAIISPAKSSDVFILQWLKVEPPCLERIAQARQHTDRVESGYYDRPTEDLSQFAGRSTSVLPPFGDGSQEDTNGARTPVELAYEADLRRVRSLRDSGKNQDEIIALVWDAKKGGEAGSARREKYEAARERYKTIVNQLEQLPQVREGY